MALDYHAVKFINTLNLSGKRILMLGRQHDRTKFPCMFAEPRFKSKGAFEVDSLDIDGGEGANIIADLNKPIKTSLYNQYDLIWDGGTLEHVFNIPVAFENVKKMLKTDGIFISQQVTGVVGHGYYVLSPELYFKWYRPENGFKDSECWSYPMTRFGRFFSLKKVIWENKRIEWSILPRMFIFKTTKFNHTTSAEMPTQCYPIVVKNNIMYWLKTLFPNLFFKNPIIIQQ